MQKMRVLTFVQIAEGKSELSFDTIETELQLDLDDVEAFIIDGALMIISLSFVYTPCPENKVPLYFEYIIIFVPLEMGMNRF